MNANPRHNKMYLDAEEKEETPSQEIDFCTLGMFIIDEIHYLPPKPPVYDILGGAGAYAALGARLFSPPPISKTISWIVDEGSDFPTSIRDQIEAWGTSCLIRSDGSRLTTRGWNGYDENQNRQFKYTTPKLRLDHESLTDTLLFSKSFHLICSPARCIQLTSSILRKRQRTNPRASKPIFIWEPVPDLCKPTELLNTTNALPYVDICSPNHHELAALMGDPNLGIDPLTGAISTTSVEQACEQLLGSMPLQSYTLLIRCGPKGCYVAKNGGRSSGGKRKRPANHARGGLTPEVDMMALFSGMVSKDGYLKREVATVDPGIERWIPAYFGSGDQPAPDSDSTKQPSLQASTTAPSLTNSLSLPPTSPAKLSTPPTTLTAQLSQTSLSESSEPSPRVVDPTGGGNAFLGGFSIALARGQPILEATAWGSVAASFAIEQVGTPTLSSSDKGEMWNGVNVNERLKEFLERCGLPE